MSENDRIPCEVPFCRRTIGQQRLREGDNAWLCPNHWRLIPKGRKQVYSLARRRGNHRAAQWIWPRLVAVATEKATGI